MFRREDVVGADEDVKVVVDSSKVDDGDDVVVEVDDVCVFCFNVVVEIVVPPR